MSEENERPKAQLTEIATEHWQAKSLTPEKRDRILAALRVGKQSPQYKRVKAELDQWL